MTPNCNDCRHFIEDEVMVCEMGHKPRFYLPQTISRAHAGNWGWKRRCNDRKPRASVEDLLKAIEGGESFSVIEEAAAQVRARRNTDAIDAARYRWLRDTQNASFRDPMEQDCGVDTGGMIENILIKHLDSGFCAYNGKDLDGAIDDAMNRWPTPEST